MIDNIAKFCVELEATFNDSALTRVYKDFNNAGREVSDIFESIKREAEESAGVVGLAAADSFSSLRGDLADFFNYTSESFGDIDSLIKKVWSNMANSFADAVAKMASDNILSGLFGGGGLFGGIFGGLLGSRRSGGTIDKTGPYYLHEGEFVLPPEVVSAVRGGSYVNSQPSSSGGQTSLGGINVTVNTPVTINGAADKNDAQKLCEEISRAARRGVSWAVEQAKISYKIGRERSSESSL